MTWVLVVLANVYYGNSIATVPGYASEAACEAAGKQYVERTSQVAAYGASRIKYACFAGPALGSGPR